MWQFQETNGIGPSGPRLEYVSDPHRFKVVVAGRRSGKTLLAKRILKRWMSNVHVPEPQRFIFTGPTQAQTERIGIPDMLEFLKPIIKSVRVTPLPVIRTLLGHELWFAGVDQSSRIEGVAIDGIVCDEFHEYKPDVFDSTIAPMLVDRSARMIALGIPRPDAPNIEVLKRLWAEGAVPNDRIKSYTWFSSDVVPIAELEALRSTMLSWQFRTEFEASWDAPPSGGLFNPEWWKVLTPEVWNSIREKPTANFRWARGWDPAGGQSKGSDYSSGGLVGHEKNGSRIIIADITRGQWSPKVRNDMMVATARADEKFEAGNYFWKSRTPDMNRSILEGTNEFGFWAITERGRKFQRAQRLAVQAEAGNVYLAPGAWNAAFIAEAAQFKDEDSDEVRKDDQVDSVCLADSQLVKWN